MPAAPKWSYFQEARDVAGFISGRRGGRLTSTGAASVRLVASARFKTSLLLLADGKSGLRLHTLAKEGLCGHRGCVPNRLVELPGGCRPLAWVPGPVERTCSLHSKQCVTLYKSFCLLGLRLCHQLSGYHDASAHLKGLRGPEQAPGVASSLRVTVSRWGKKGRTWQSNRGKLQRVT